MVYFWYRYEFQNFKDVHGVGNSRKRCENDLDWGGKNVRGGGNVADFFFLLIIQPVDSTCCQIV